MNQHYDIIIKGRVQNVGFRFYAQKKAHELNISGLVKNQTDGSVFIEAEGEPGELQEFLEWCHRGPSWAHVTEVHVNESPFTNMRGFVVS